MQFGIPLLAMFAALLRAATLPGGKLIWFEIYLAVAIARASSLWLALGHDYLYGAIWFYSEPLISALWIAMAVELYARVTDLYPGMSKPGWATAALVAAVVIMMATLVEDHSTWKMQNIFLLRRATATILSVAMTLLAMLFGYFRNSIPPNLVRHAAIMAAYFLTQAVPFFAMNFTKRNGNWDLLYVWGAVAGYGAWASMLTSVGQQRPEFIRTKTDEELEGTDEKIEAMMALLKSAGRGPDSKRD